MNFIVGAEVHKELSNGYRLKVTIEALGVYVNGFRVLPGKNEHKWWVLPPQTKTGTRYIDIIEFDKSLDLWIDINNACIDAVESYQPETKIPELTKEQHDKFMSEEIDKRFKEIDNSTGAVPWLKD